MKATSLARPQLPVLIGVGLVGGFASGLFGVGGGVVLVPLLVFVIGTSQHTAHGTSLAIVLAASITGSITYAQHGFLPPETLHLILEFVTGSVIGVNIGARLMMRINASRLKLVFGIFMVVVGLRLALPFASAVTAPLDWQATNIGTIAVVIAFGMIVGILSGLLGVGGGVFIVPFTVIALGAPQQIAQAVSLAVVVPTSLFGSLTHYRRGNINLRLAFWVGIGSVLAAIGGGQLAASVDSVLLGRLFGGMLMLTGIRMLWPQRAK